jgi:hypothetical protein
LEISMYGTHIDPTSWMNELMVKQKDLLQSLVPSPGTGDQAPDLVAPWQQAADAIGHWQRQALDQMTSVWSATVPLANAGGAADDKRFAGEAWQKDPRFELVAKAYLSQSEMMRKALDAAPLDDRSKAQWGFVLRQLIDALSPMNALVTNPDALQTALDSGGQSLIEGARLFMQDFAKGRVSMTDDQAFEVGRNVATRPGSVVFENDVCQVIQYAPSTDEVHERPLVMVPPCINKFYILDLQPDNSLVAYAASQGHTVFLVSWRNAGPEQSQLRWDDYVEQGVMQAIDVALEISGADRVNTLGFCIGGTLLASTLAVLAARGEQKAASMTLLTTMLDFTDTGEIGLLVTEPAVVAREAAIGSGGLLKGSEGIRRAARKRPDLAVRGGRLPEGQGAAGVRPAVLEQRRHQPAGTAVLLVRAQHLSREQAARAWRDDGLRRAGRPGQDRRAGVPVRLARGPHRAVADGVHEHAAARRRRHVRTWRERPHRRGDQPAGQEEAQLLDGQRLSGCAGLVRPCTQ